MGVLEDLEQFYSLMTPTRIPLLPCLMGERCPMTLVSCSPILFHRYEYNGRTLKVHHDRFTQIESPQPSLPNYHRSVSGSPPDNSPPPMLSIHQPPAPSFSQPTIPQSPYFRLASQSGSPFHQFLPLSTGSQGVMGFTQTPGQHPLHAQRNHQYLHEASTPTLQIPSIRPTTESHNAVPGEISAAKGSEHPPPVAPGAPSSNTGTASTAPGAERPIPLQNVSQSTAATKPSASSTGRAPPGTLSLPSQAFSISNPLSPHLTRGLPPMTPSMPGFTFHAPPVSWSFTSHYSISLFSLIILRCRRHQLHPTSCHPDLAHSRPR